MRRRSRIARTCLAVAALGSVVAAGCDRLSGPERLSEIHIYAAQTYLRDGQPGLAVAELEKALELAPEYPKTRLLLGVAYDKLDKFDEATQEFRFVTERDPDEEKAWLFWGSMLYRMGRANEAVAKLEQAARLAPDSAHIQRELGLALTGVGRHADAVSTFERMHGLEGEPSDAAFAAWGTSLVALGRGADARFPLEAGLRLNPDHLGAMSLLGALLEGSEDPADRAVAIELYERALRARPGDAAALHNLGRAYLQEGRHAEAYDLIQRSVALTDPSDSFYAARRANLERARAGLPRTEARADVPNIVLIVLDTLRADHLGSYGYPRETSPHIDGLAARGVVFENAISQAPWTAASIGSLFTSLYPSVHGIDGGVRWGGAKPAQQSKGALPFAVQRALRPGQLTLAEMLRRNGYRTAGFVSNVYVNSIFGFSQGFETYHDEHGDYSDDVGRAKRRAVATNRQVFQWLDGELEEPFFLFVHYNDCHWPYDPPAPYGREWVTDYEGELTPERTTAIVERQGEPITDLDEADLRYLIGLYDGEIAYVDAAVGDLTEKVRSLGLERDVLTVVTADHGEEFLDHGGASHGYTLFEEQIRVPLVFHAPGRLSPRRIPAQVRVIDVMPSLLELAGIEELPGSLQGESFVAILNGDGGSGSRAAFSEATYKGAQRSLRTDNRFKLIHPAEGQPSLFDLGKDPRERSDLALEQSDRASTLLGELERWTQSNLKLRDEIFAGEAEQDVILDEETQERLRALGYIE